MAPRVHYEITLLPPVGGGPWRYVATITRGSGPGSSWTSQPVSLVATDKESASAEARAHVATLAKTLAG